MFFEKLIENGGGCRSEGLLRLVNQKGAGFRFLITPVGLFQKSPCACSIPPYLNTSIVSAVGEECFAMVRTSDSGSESRWFDSSRQFAGVVQKPRRL